MQPIIQSQEGFDAPYHIDAMQFETWQIRSSLPGQAVGYVNTDDDRRKDTCGGVASRQPALNATFMTGPPVLRDQGGLSVLQVSAADVRIIVAGFFALTMLRRLVQLEAKLIF